MAIDVDTSRSGSTGSAARRETFGKASGLEEGQRLRRGKGRALGRQERIRRDAEGAVMVEAAPATPLKVIQAEFVLELLIVPLESQYFVGADSCPGRNRRRPRAACVAATTRVHRASRLPSS